MKAAVLALQGDFDEHAKALKRNIPEIEIDYIRKKEDFAKHARTKLLVIPGGESSTFSKLIDAGKTRDVLTDFLNNDGLTVLTTCAGTILLSKKIKNPGKSRNIGILDITTERNSYGRQINSFITQGQFHMDSYLDVPLGGQKDQRDEMVFIRAPKIIDYDSKTVDVIAYEKRDPVLIRQGRFLAATFHPELTEKSFVYDILRKMI